ncbi:MAG: acyl-CoA dehydrogenase family protein, partial [Syntrophomonadaceae bacterium]|nr:acyl-CoA dehydrogenase family protein [Syntrophomonadaceae bacterium]
MPYELTDEQVMLRNTVRRLANEKIAPRASEIDRTGEYPYDILQLFRENDLMAVNFPPEYGGQGAGIISVCIIVEEVARVDASCSIIPANAELSFGPLLLAGTEEQKKKYLPRVVTGEIIGAFCLTEPEAGSDAGAISTRAVKQGNEWVINGRKCFTTNGGIADVYTVFARSVPDSKGIKGLSVFMVEKDTPGLIIGKRENKMGLRGSPTTEEFFEDCRVPLDNLVGNEGDGFRLAMLTLDRTRPVIGAQAVGIAQGACDYALQYAKQRVQFGQPIAKFQGIQWKLAEMFTLTEAARQLVYRAATVLDRLGPAIDRFPPEVSMLSAQCKLFASEVAMRVTTEAVQVLGGYGYMRDYPVERMMRDAKVTQIYEGTSEIQKIVIARALV